MLTPDRMSYSIKLVQYHKSLLYCHMMNKPIHDGDHT